MKTPKSLAEITPLSQADIDQLYTRSKTRLNVAAITFIFLFLVMSVFVHHLPELDDPLFTRKLSVFLTIEVLSIAAFITMVWFDKLRLSYLPLEQSACQDVLSAADMSEVRDYVDRVVALNRRLTKGEGDMLIRYQRNASAEVKNQQNQRACRILYRVDPEAQ